MFFIFNNDQDNTFSKFYVEIRLQKFEIRDLVKNMSENESNKQIHSYSRDGKLLNRIACRL